MERTGADRRPNMKIPVEQPIRTSRFAHLAKAGPAETASLLTSSSVTLAAFTAIALLYGFDSYFFGGYYGNATEMLFRQIRGAFGL